MHAETVSETLTRLANSDLGRKVLAEARVEELEQRRQLVAEARRLGAERERRGAESAREVEQAKGERERAEARLKGAFEAERNALSRAMSVSVSLEYGIAACEDKLRKTASPQIHELLAWIEKTFEAARGSVAAQSSNLDWQARAAENQQLLRQHRASIASIFAAREAARALMLEALDEDELERRLAEIRATVPSEWGAA